MMRINELIVSPWICIFFLLLNQSNVMMVVTTAIATYTAWAEWLEYQELRYIMQRMHLTCLVTGGPFIRTNDDEYLPYVFADAVLRWRMRHPDSEKDRPQEAPLTHSR